MSRVNTLDANMDVECKSGKQLHHTNNVFTFNYFEAFCQLHNTVR